MSEEEESRTTKVSLPQKKKTTTTTKTEEDIELDDEMDLEESLKRKINLLQVREDEDHEGTLLGGCYTSDELKIFSHEEEEEECLEEGEEEELRAVLSEEKNSLIEETEGAPPLEGPSSKILPPLDLNTLAACSAAAAASNSSASSTSSSIGMASNGRPSSSNTLEAKIQTGGGAKSDSSPSSPLCTGYPLHSPYSSNGANNNNNNSSSSSSYINGSGATPPSSSGPPPLSMVRSPESPESPYLYNGNSSDPLGSPPPAHLGGLPYNLASDGGKGLRSSLYSPPSVPPNASSSSPGYPYSLLGGGGGSGGEQFGGGSCSSFSRFGSLFSSPGFHPPLTGDLETIPPPPPTPPHHINHPILNGNHSRLSSNPSSRSLCPTSSSSSSRSNKKTTSSGSSGSSNSSSSSSSSSSASSKTHIKKPLNAFMLYMKEMRPTIVAECTLKESAAINQILGRRWHGLSREEQAKYYESARKERQLHMQMYPGWSARDNYAQNKKKKRKREGSSSSQIKSSSASSVLVNNIKKCRARYGMDQQDLWCKPCSPLTINNNNHSSSNNNNNNSLNTTPSTPDPRELFLHHHHQSSQLPGGGHAMVHGEDLTLDPRLNSHFLLHHHHHHHHHLTSSTTPTSPPQQNQGSLVDHLSSQGQLDLSMSNTGSLPPPLAPLHDSTRSNHILDHHHQHHPLEPLKAHQHPPPPGGSLGDESSPKYISL